MLRIRAMLLKLCDQTVSESVDDDFEAETMVAPRVWCRELGMMMAACCSLARLMLLWRCERMLRRRKGV